MDDTSYEMLFKPVMRKVMEVYQPEVIVFQSGVREQLFFQEPHVCIARNLLKFAEICRKWHASFMVNKSAQQMQFSRNWAQSSQLHVQVLIHSLETD